MIFLCFLEIKWLLFDEMCWLFVEDSGDLFDFKSWLEVLDVVVFWVFVVIIVFLLLKILGFGVFDDFLMFDLFLLLVKILCWNCVFLLCICLEVFFCCNDFFFSGVIDS